MPTMNILHTPSTAAGTPRFTRLAALALLLAGVAAGAMAQTYKVIGPDGKVTYTDTPPTASAIKAPSQTTSGGDSTDNGIPYATRQAMAKYPVTLYSAKDCQGCDMARQMLRQRGVPFTEYSVTTNADIAALQARFGSTAAPVVQIGGQSMKGYASSDLTNYLDAAGYPAQARLTGYSWPPATPLAPRGAAVPATAAADPGQAASSPASQLPPPSKSGIQF
jgi:glutaredoxin